ASSNPDKAEVGGTLGFPAGSVVTITAAQYTTWEDAGESALKSGREAADPALKLVGDIEGGEDDVDEFLGARRAERPKARQDREGTTWGGGRGDREGGQGRGLDKEQASQGRGRRRGSGNTQGQEGKEGRRRGRRRAGRGEGGARCPGSPEVP